jgi:hypothetical protein
MKKVESYVEELFENAPKSKRTRELKEELMLDLNEKYTDLIKDGKNESEAYNEVVSGIGDIDELLNINEDDVNYESLRKKNALVVSICVGLYILSFIVAIILDEILNVDDAITGISFFVICGLSTCILIYHNMAKPNYLKKDDTMVEEFREWKSNRNKNKEIKRSVVSIMWSIIVILYFIISFATYAWYITWVIFIIGGLVNQIINLIFTIKE